MGQAEQRRRRPGLRHDGGSHERQQQRGDRGWQSEGLDCFLLLILRLRLRLSELLVTCIRFEAEVFKLEPGRELKLSHARDTVAAAVVRELPIVWQVHMLMAAVIPSSDPDHDPQPAEGWETRGCQCKACVRLTEERDASVGALQLMDLGPSTPVWSLLVESSDYTTECRSAAEAGASRKQRSQALADVTLAARIMPDRSVRLRLFNALLNATSVQSRARPEISFRRNEEGLPADPSKAKPQRSREANNGRSGNGSSASPSASASADRTMWAQLKEAFLADRISIRASILRSEVGHVTWKTILAGAMDQGAAGLPGPFRQSIFEICQDLNRAALSPDTLLISNSSSNGSNSSGGAVSVKQPLLITCPNTRTQTGDERNKLIVNPGALGHSLTDFRILGQLMGIAIRSKNCLDLDLSEVVWKQILGQKVQPRDLQAFDYSAYRSLQFADPVSDTPFDEKEFGEYFDLNWTTVLSDGSTVVDLKPGGRSEKLRFQDRWEYAGLAIQARLYESALQIQAIRDGFYSVIPQEALTLLSWDELELRVCGRPTVDLEVLKRHTVYAPSGYTANSPAVKMFWQVLSEFADEERAKFLQFAWARSRLPSEMGSYRMQLNILDADSEDKRDQALPTSETCFFNVSVQKYSTLEIMRSKIRLALTCSTITS